MHALITGGLGFIGHRVGLALLEQGARVTIVDLPSFGPAALPPAVGPVDIVVADIRDCAEWIDALDDVDVIVHSAGIHQVDEVAVDPLRHVDVNVRGTQILLEAAVERNVPRFVYLSSAKVYGQIGSVPSREGDLVAPVEAYALGKVVAEGYCEHYADAHGLDVSMVRPFSVYGPGQDTHTGYVGALLEALQRGGRVVLPGSAETSRDFVHVQTVVDVCVAAATSPGPPPRVLNAGSGTSTMLGELVETFEQASGRALDVSYRDPRPGTLERSFADVTVMTEFTCPDFPSLPVGIKETIDAQLGMP